MSDHDCAGCWRYDAETDTETCMVCGAVRAPQVVPDGGRIACPACGHTFSAPESYENGKGTYCPECGHGFAHGRPVTDGGQLVADPDADLAALKTVACVGCGASLPLTETARFAKVGELESGWLCEDCDAALCDGRGWIRFPIAGEFDCPECNGGESA